MGKLFDIEKERKEAEAQERALDIMLDILSVASPRKAIEVKLLKTARKVSTEMKDKALKCAMNESLSDEQIESVANYFEMVLAGFNTFMEQFESTINKENPHSSGN